LLCSNRDFLAGMAGISTTLYGNEGVGAWEGWRPWLQSGDISGAQRGEGKGVEGERCDCQGKKST
jgi:hypothetical protein